MSCRALVAGLLLTFAAWVGTYLIALHSGYYLAVWFPGLYLLGLLAHSIAERLRQRGARLELS